MEKNEAPFEIKVVTQPYVEKCLEFVREFFYKDEPMNQYLDSKRGEVVNSSGRGEYLRDFITKGLSVMAVTPSEEVIGICVHSVSKSPIDHPNIGVISKIMRTLEKQEEITIDEGTKIMKLKMLTVHRNWRNMGIGQCLLNYIRQLAKQNGFSYIKGICSSEYTIKLFQRQGFECIAAIKYEDFKIDGEVVLKPALPHTHLKSMLLKL